ncbi:hypothetical protein EYF80_051710 [Liparis tanakae]|uniref:Uncharacterized protein n=1 Tax=Liparis tanakae TaxID=230148 RepID=A0A4Z2FB53_9TELE|nr:hypothetical protein EYF80_051710 [Liparis tanakae]
MFLEIIREAAGCSCFVIGHFTPASSHETSPRWSSQMKFDHRRLPYPCTGPTGDLSPPPLFSILTEQHAPTHVSEFPYLHPHRVLQDLYSAELCSHIDNLQGEAGVRRLVGPPAWP